MVQQLAAILGLVLLACNQAQSLGHGSEHQLTTLIQKPIRVWQADLAEGASVFWLNPVRGALEPSTKPVYYEQKVLLTDFLNNGAVLPGWIAIQQTGTLDDDFYFVRDSQLTDHRPIQMTAWGFNALQCPFYEVTENGRIVPIGKLPDMGFGFPVDPTRPAHVGAYVRIVLDSGRTAYASSDCVHFGPTKARATLKRIRERIMNASVRAWDVRVPNSIQPDFESSVRQFIEPLLYAVSLPEYEAAVRFDFWSELENAIVAIFTARIEAVSIDTVIPGIWGFPTAQLTPTQIALLAMSLPMLNGLHMAEMGTALITYFMDPKYGSADLSCQQLEPANAQARSHADSLLKEHVAPNHNWLHDAKAVNDLLQLPAIPETDVLDSLVYAFGLLAERESAIGRVPNSTALFFAPGNELEVRAPNVIVHNHVPAAQLRQSDLAGIPEASTIQYFEQLHSSRPEIEHPVRRLGMRGASAVFIIHFEDEAVYQLARDNDIAATANQSDHSTRLVVPCPGQDGKPYETWEHFNDLTAPSEWRTPFGRVTLRPVMH